MAATAATAARTKLPPTSFAPAPPVNVGVALPPVGLCVTLRVPLAATVEVKDTVPFGPELDVVVVRMVPGAPIPEGPVVTEVVEVPGVPAVSVVVPVVAVVVVLESVTAVVEVVVDTPEELVVTGVPLEMLNGAPVSG